MKKRTIRSLAVGLSVASVALSLVACSASGSSSSNNSNSNSNSQTSGSLKGTTLEYWASNQAASVTDDTNILTPELAKFEKKTGIKVNLQVFPWGPLNTNLQAAVVSGKGPDVFNFGNTNTHAYAATGALLPLNKPELDTIGGADRYVSTVWAVTGPRPVTSVPLYAQAVGLFYNKKMFADAGLKPPTTWEELVTDAKKFTDPSKGTYGLAVQGASLSETNHYAYIFGVQNGASPFNSKDEPTFTKSGIIAGGLQYLDLMQKGVVNPSDAQYTSATQQLTEFVNNKAAMAMDQNSVIPTLTSLGMTPDQYGVVAIPAPSPLPSGGKNIGSFVAGTNIAVFKNTKHKEAALQLIRFLTSPAEQKILDKSYQLLPVLKGQDLSEMSDPTLFKTFSEILAKRSKPMPVTANILAYQNTLSSSLMSMFRDAATGKKFDSDAVKQAFDAAQQKMPQ